MRTPAQLFVVSVWRCQFGGGQEGKTVLVSLKQTEFEGDQEEEEEEEGEEEARERLDRC